MRSRSLVVFLARPDGNETTNVREMDGLLHEAINRKYAEAPDPCPDAFMAKYGHHLQKVPMLASKLTQGHLCKCLWAMSPSSVLQDP